MLRQISIILGIQMRNFPRFPNKFSLSGIAMLLIIIRRARKEYQTLWRCVRTKHVAVD
jgi:hypothetical protein